MSPRNPVTLRRDAVAELLRAGISYLGPHGRNSCSSQRTPMWVELGRPNLDESSALLRQADGSG